MRRILVCTGILGGGTALVFALAAATAMLFPQGTLVSAGWNGDMRFPGREGAVMFQAVDQVVTIEGDGTGGGVNLGGPVPMEGR